MNRAAKAMIARDPLISANSVRFLLMAGVRGSTFLAGFRPRQDGEKMMMGQTGSGSLTARRAAIHGGTGSFFSDANSRKIKLSYRTHQYDYDEYAIYMGPGGCSVGTELSIEGTHLPYTVIDALAGRRLCDVIGYENTPAFFASKFTTILQAEMSDFPGSDALVMILNIKWYPLSRVLPYLL